MKFINGPGKLPVGRSKIPTATFVGRISRSDGENSSEWNTKTPTVPGKYWSCRLYGTGKYLGADGPKVELSYVIELNGCMFVDLGPGSWISSVGVEEYTHWIGPFDKVPAEPDPPGCSGKCFKDVVLT